MQLPVYVFVFFYLILPNLPALLCSRWLEGLPHGYINLEILLIGAIAVFLPRGVVFTLLLVDAVADFAYTVCYTYQFSLANLLSSLRYLPVMPWTRVVEGAVSLVVAIAASTILVFIRPLPRKRLQTMFAIVITIGILVAVDIADGNSFNHRDMSLVSVRVGRSPVLVLAVREAATHLYEEKSRSTDDLPMTSASSHAIKYLESRPPGTQAPNLVLIVVESWGLALDPRLAAALTATYDNPGIAARYTVTHGTAPFAGLTVPGEARELCQSTMGFSILHTPPSRRSQCLPEVLHARGYRNIAVHGYVGQMFYRSAWYPDLGFDRTFFAPDLEKNGLSRCTGAFPGVCDTSIAEWIGSSLLSSTQARPAFIYWVTLNSHIPVPEHPDLPADRICSAQPVLSGSAPLCSWFRLVRAVHFSISEVALQTSARPTIFLLVGDHAPPFADPRLRGGFSSTEVPYVMLTPIAGGHEPNIAASFKKGKTTGSGE